jgi:hypothetical protein
MEGPVGFVDWLKTIFDPSAATSPDELPLDGASESGLASSLRRLPVGERGWIALTDAARLFSMQEREYAFGDFDDEGKNRLSQFAAGHRCLLDFRPVERRLYFRKSG